MLGLMYDSASSKQPNYDAQSDQANKAIITKTGDQIGQIGHNIAKECHLSSKEHSQHDSKGDQQQENFSYFTQPPFDLFQITHTMSPTTSNKDTRHIMPIPAISSSYLSGFL
jgi:hypothetical protein